MVTSVGRRDGGDRRVVSPLMSWKVLILFHASLRLGEGGRFDVDFSIGLVRRGGAGYSIFESRISAKNLFFVGQKSKTGLRFVCGSRETAALAANVESIVCCSAPPISLRSLSFPQHQFIAQAPRATYEGFIKYRSKTSSEGRTQHTTRSSRSSIS